MVDYPKKQLQELYENIPKNLQEAVFSEKTADKIYDICTKNNIKDEEKIKEITKNIGYVLLGIISPNNLQKTLEKEIKLNKTTAKNIFQEINNFVFFPLKDSLEALYKIKIEGEPEEKTKEELEQKKSRPKRKDKYREPIE